MSDFVQREWRFYIDDMIGFAEKVTVYTDRLDQAGFVTSAVCRMAKVDTANLGRRMGCEG